MFSLSALLGFPQFNERDVQTRMQQFENARRNGTFVMPHAMDAAGQEALRRLMKGQTAGPQFDAPINQNPPQPDPRYTPVQGGAWDDAEAEQQKLVNAGLPTIR
jgi:hypothetical protein